MNGTVLIQAQIQGETEQYLQTFDSFNLGIDLGNSGSLATMQLTLSPGAFRSIPDTQSLLYIRATNAFTLTINNISYNLDRVFLGAAPFQALLLSNQSLTETVTIVVVYS